MFLSWSWVMGISGENDDDASDSDGDDASTNAAAVVPDITSPRGSNKMATRRNPRQQGSVKAGLDRNRSGVFNAVGNSSISHLQLAMEGEEKPPRTARRQPSPRPISPRTLTATTRAVVEMPSLANPQVYQQIPFASPVFLMDPQANLPASDFWQAWKQSETTYVS
ncbi:unnamed protein product [Phytophthora fragariaefolia]|uniref:Unnamed protein product n=1 Tax=Phytophthora fragariaefolia TaxID=1490495 RepID=A0A9W6WV04_9STRA|nr:unnamed protein product [Phytophthora fragariaefolia]